MDITLETPAVIEETKADDCVGHKISILKNEYPDWSQDQLVAVAMEYCGESDKVEEETQPAPPVDISAVKTYFTANMAIKALGEDEDGLRIGGYLVVWGSPHQSDLQGEYFTPETDLGLDWYESRPVLYHHGLDNEVKTTTIGRIVKLVKDATGVWAEAILDKTAPFFNAIKNLVRRGLLGWSSGSAPNLVDVTDGGEIRKWPVIEGSLTPTPAEPHRTTVYALKTELTTALDNASVDTTPEEPTAKEATVGNQGAAASALTTVKACTPKRGMKMGSPELIAALEKAGVSADIILGVLKELGAETEAPAAEDAMMAAPEEQPVPEELKTAAVETPVVKTAANIDPKAIVAAIREEMRLAPANVNVQGVQRSQNTTSRIQVKSKYADLKPEEMAYLFMLNSARGKKLELSFYRELSERSIKAYNDGKLDIDRDFARTLAIKDNENNSTEAAADGLDWIPTLWSSDLWRRVRVENKVASNIETFEMPSNPYTYPIESTDPVVYAVTEAAAATEDVLTGNVFTRSKLTTDNLTFTAKKLGLQVVFTTEVNEDAIIPFIPQLREQGLRAMANAIDNVILNADATTGTGNINYKGANTSAAATSKFLYGGGDGMRHLSLIDDTSTLVDMGGARPTLDKFRTLRATMQSALQVYALDPAGMVAFVDPYTYIAMLGVDELLVWMNNGRASTVTDGALPTVDGIEVFPTAEMPLADTDGYFIAAGGGTVGSLVLAHRNSWKLGYRRQISSDVSYIPYNDQYVLTITARCALQKQSTVAAALLYNIGVS